MMDEGSVGRGDLTEVKLPALKMVWLEAPESVTQSVTAGGTITMVWKEGLVTAGPKGSSVVSTLLEVEGPVVA
jgi:hypothetical protein